jgi:citrate lyase subunit beta/citryl-CoA lyase
MRSLLFVPGNSERKLVRALDTAADAIIADLEDSVVDDAKLRARDIVGAFLTALAGRVQRPRTIVRINALDTDRWEADLQSVMPYRPDAIMLPKPRSGADVTRLADAIGRLEARDGGEVGTTRILAIATERAASLLAMASYQGASPRLQALAWGKEDLSAELGARTTVDDMGVLCSPYRLARDLTLVGAAAAGVAAIDQVYLAVHDHEGLVREAEAAARDGFDGKLALHPGQVEIINAAFTPSTEEIERAQSVVDAFERHGASSGVLLHEGQMVDAPHLARARRLLARAAAWPQPGRDGDA